MSKRFHGGCPLHRTSSVSAASERDAGVEEVLKRGLAAWAWGRQWPRI